MIDFHDVRVVCRCAFAYIHLCIVSRRVHSHRQDDATLLVPELAPAKGAAGSAPEPALATAAAGSAPAPGQEPSPTSAPDSGRPLHTLSSTHTVKLNLRIAYACCQIKFARAKSTHSQGHKIPQKRPAAQSAAPQATAAKSKAQKKTGEPSKRKLWDDTMFKDLCNRGVLFHLHAISMNLLACLLACFLMFACVTRVCW